ncbi:MAG TPA: methyltransferase domain-containing protein [Terriglobia bacterium]|nr:methyltransferase domain-containing protein [Terriglobia bacterium]
MLRNIRVFYSAIRNDFQSVGAIAPSSSLLAKAIVNPLAQRPPGPALVLEVGPGTGSFTSRILENLREGDHLDIFEVNPRFCLLLRDSLQKACLRERGIGWELFNADIRSLDRPVQYDYIISGLPLNNFHPATVAEILDILIDHLSPSGIFSYFEYVLLNNFKAKILRTTDRDRVVGVINTVRTFNQKYQYDCNHVWWNLPPARARHCRK